MTHIEDTQAKQQQQLDFFIRTSTPPAEMVFFEGDFYTARVALENLVRSANHRVIIIDGYVSSLTLSVLDVRKPDVTATVYTAGVGQGMQRLMDEHDRLFPNNHIDIRKWHNDGGVEVRMKKSSCCCCLAWVSSIRVIRLSIFSCRAIK